MTNKPEKSPHRHSGKAPEAHHGARKTAETKGSEGRSEAGRNAGAPGKPEGKTGSGTGFGNPSRGRR